ncbi:Zinc knuckle [Carex littledalei]|uniref:Zinc knuckle n=1 Tax=Carex littledalei TaxID=544730 RepID=A0A833QUR0_9POAL|nr:Zinc knuckle [Carex littledalei]
MVSIPLAVRQGAHGGEGQASLRDIPTVVATHQGATLEGDRFLLIGSFPILRFSEKSLEKDIESDQQVIKNINSQRATDGQASKGQHSTLSRNEVLSNLEIASNKEEQQGWTLVTRRKRSNFRSKAPQRGNIQWTKLSIHATKLRQQQKCFKCLLKGHIQAVCQNSRRCLYCNTPGHIIRDCPSRFKGNPKDTSRNFNSYKKGNPSTQSKPSPKPAPIHSHSTFKKTNPLKGSSSRKSNNMDVPRDWLTMPMNEPVDLWQLRPQFLNVYIAPREQLSPANMFLERSAFIFAGPGGSDPYLHHRIAACMARHFQRDPEDFRVYTIDEDFGDVLLMFPTETMARAAIDRASFYIGNNIEIALHPYSPELQMAFDPMGGRARIKIYGLPLQHWNRIDMMTLVSGFGYPLRTAPYFTNGNYEYLTMLVACKKAEDVPFNLKLRVNPQRKDVRVVLDGWLSNQGPYHSHHSGGTERRPRGRSLHRGEGSRGRQNQTIPEAHRGSARRGEREHGQDRISSSEGSNWVNNLRNALLQAGILQVNNANEAAPKIINIQDQQTPSQGTLVLAQPGNHASDSAELIAFKKVIEQSAINGNVTKTGVVEMSFKGKSVKGHFMLSFDKDNSDVPFGNMEKGDGSGLGKGISEQQKTCVITEINELEEEMIGNGTIANQIGKKGQGGDTTAMQAELFEKVEEQEGTVQNQVEAFGPPPGFENLVIHKEKEESQTMRRSKRLSEKYSEERLKYNSGKRTYKKKGSKPKPVKLDYKESLNPLSMDQAKLMVQLAGVEVSGAIEDEVAQVVHA